MQSISKETDVVFVVSEYKQIRYVYHTDKTDLRKRNITFHFHALEKEMATHSSVLAWRIPGTGEPDGLWSMGSHRVGHN